MKKYCTLISFTFLLSCLQAQITSFPYVENFDGFPPGVQGSYVEPNPQSFPGSWANEIIGDDNQDWYAVSGNTPSNNTGPTADHTSGSGEYLCVEDSDADNNSVILNSPVFNISSLSNPLLNVWIHSDANTFGASFGGDSSLNDLKIEVFFGGSWILIDSIGNLDADWTEFSYDISAYTGGNIQFRFRANSNNYTDFVHDIAIDDFSILNKEDFDASIEEASFTLLSPDLYTLAPSTQGGVYLVQGKIANKGLNNLTDVKLKVSADSYSDSASIVGLFVGASLTLALPDSFTPIFSSNVNFSISTAEADGQPDNNLFSVPFPDSTLARDDSLSDGGLGFTGNVGTMGMMFEIFEEDYFTSVSFFLTDGTVTGDSIRLLIYGYGNETPNTPDMALLTSPQIWTIPGGGWHTISLTCPILLSPGKYFVGLSETSNNNLSLGYDLDNYIPNVPFFKSGSGTWTELGVSLPSLASSFMIRMNFGTYIDQLAANITTERNFICMGDTIALFASSSDPAATYIWSGDDLNATNLPSVLANPSESTTYSVIATDSKGCTSKDSVTINVNTPLVTASSTLAWAGVSNGTATAIASGGIPPYSFTWNDSLSQTTETAVGLTAGLYTVTLTDSLGCSTETTVPVYEATTGLSSLDTDALQLYPNPNKGQFTLQGLEALGLNNDIHIKVIDSKGSVIFQERMKGRNKALISLPNDLSNGLYMIEVRNSETRWTWQMMIQN